MKIRFSKDPLAPIEGIVQLLLGFVASIAALFLLASVFGPPGEVSVLGVGDSEVCVDNAGIGVMGQSERQARREADALGLKDNARTAPGETTVCNTTPGVKEQALGGLSIAPTFLVFTGFLFLTRRAVTRARRTGLFTRSTARSVQQLGRFLLVGIVVAALLEWLAKGLLLSTMVEGANWNDGPPYVSVAALLGGLGVVTVGRVLHRAVELQDEVDVTI